MFGRPHHRQVKTEELAYKSSATLYRTEPSWTT